MNRELMIKHYNATSKETLINILVSSRERVIRLSQRNKKYRNEIERLQGIIKQIYEIFKTGHFEDGCDCAEIEGLIQKEIEGERE